MVGPHCSAETLSALLDGELTVDERALARAHVTGCLACGARLAAGQQLDSSLRDTGRLSCASLRPSLSALADGEATAGERALATGHLVDCADCRATSATLRDADVLLATLPVAAPSSRVDAAIAALGRPGRRVALRPATLALRTAAAIALAVLVAAGATLVPGGAPAATQAQRTAEIVLVASVQRVVFDGRTNTLYVLDPTRADVSVVDATTQTERARVAIGGRPTALALSVSQNRVLVLDGTTKVLTEIDASSNTVVASSTLVVTGTPTSLQVDANGKIVVASVSADAATTSAAASPSTANGHVTVFDALSKQVETVRAVDVAPQLVVLDAKGAQALLLSASATTLVDALTYTSIDRLPGGVAAAFDVSGGQVAVLSSDGANGSRLSFRGAGLPASLSIPGRPVALIPMPDGGFAALVDRGAAGEVEVIDAAGRITSSVGLALVGHSLTYDPITARFAVGGDGEASLAFTAAPAAAVAPAAGQTAPQGPATGAPTASVAPSASPSAPAATAPVSSAPPAVPAAAQPATGGYRLALTGNRRPVLVAGSGGTLWFIDAAKRLATIDTASGAVVDLAQLPLDATVARLLVGSAHVYAIDRGQGRISVFTLATGIQETIAFPFAAIAAGFSVGPDDRLWMAGGESSNVLALDPATKRVAAIDFRTSRISALHVDSAARVWFADDATGGIGYYDQSTKTIVTVAVPRHASVTALSMDRDGTLWAGTSFGELIWVRLGVAGTAGIAGTAGGSVNDLVRDASGGVWSYATAPGTLVYRAATTGGGPRIVAGGATAMAFDGLGRVWLAVPGDGSFYIAQNGGG